MTFSSKIEFSEKELEKFIEWIGEWIEYWGGMGNIIDSYDIEERLKRKLNYLRRINREGGEVEWKDILYIGIVTTG